LFGAPAAHEDDPERAVRAALAIRDASLEQGVELRIGVNTGEALVTIGARPDAGQTMATGDVVNTAARLQSAAPVGGVLVGEPAARIEAEPDLISWRQGRCLPYGDGVTFWALGEMVKAQAGILETDSREETERKLREAAIDPWVESHLQPLVGITSEATAGGDRRGEAFAAWRRFFETLAEQRPLVLVFEDLHWADENLLDFVDYLVEWATGVPILIVATSRPELLERRPAWGGGKLNVTTLSLAPLSND